MRVAISVILFFGFCCTQAAAREPSLIQISDGQNDYSGKLLAMNDTVCWFMERDGRVKRFAIDSLKNFKRVGPRFKAEEIVTLRNELRKEFGKSFEVTAKGRYLVAAKRGRAKDFAQVLDQVYGVFRREFTTRGFEIEEPEVPLIAVVFPNRSQYLSYADKDNFAGAEHTLGYYKSSTNRVALFEDTPADDWGVEAACDDDEEFAVIDSDLRDTLIHEAIHQIAFNTRVHNRVGKNPRWVVEGLATVFEAPGIRNRANRYRASTRINRDRYLAFMNFLKNRREENSLSRFLASDDAFHQTMGDAYAQCWALSYYLFETRGQAYSKYLKTISDRDPLIGYNHKARLSDFEEAFGDIDELETRFVRYMNRLKL